MDLMELKRFEGHGVEIENSPNGKSVTVSTNVMAWLLNRRNMPEGYGVVPPESLRELRIKAFPLPVYDDGREYVSFCFYLNGSPPKQIYVHHDDNSGFRDHFNPDAQVYERFGFDRENWVVTVRFTPEEVATLKAGDVVIVKPT
jgi:hypothetical protein